MALRRALAAVCISAIIAVFVLPIPFQLASELYWTIAWWASVTAALTLAFLAEKKEKG